MPSRAPSASSSLEDWLRWQEQLHPQAIALGLERIRPVGEKLGLQAAGPATLTIAGTNGKGSTAALASSIYRTAGYAVGTYTSPHLLRYNERVAVNGRELADTDLVRAFAEVELARGAIGLTYFEFGTLAALWLFREAAVQVQVLEVGMGGRLDAVNLVDPDVAVVTNIGLDHVDYLGATREQIGMEKAGIFRSGRPAICVDPDPPGSIASHAAAVGAKFWQLGRDFEFQHASDAWNWHAGDIRYKKLPPPALAGEAQFRNAAGVLAALTLARERLPVDETAIRTGLSRLSLRGRFERRGDIVLDVAHNVEAARVLADNLRAAGAGRCRFVVGMLSDKPVEGFAAALAPLAAAFHAGGLPPPRGLTGQALADRIAAMGPSHRVSASDTVEQAFAQAQAQCRAGETLVVCGSFLTVAAVTRLLDG